MMENRFLTDADIDREHVTPEQLENAENPIDLSLDRVLCPRHGEPFRAHWPKGFPTMAVAAIGTIMEDPAFQALTEGKVERINEILADRPICERVSSPTMMSLYITSGIGTEHRCDLCHEKGLGAPYTMGRPGGKTKTYRHVCFSCVIYRLQPAN